MGYKIHGVVISDIHIGAFDLTTQEKELREIFFFNLKNTNEKIDLIIINGDVFHRGFNLNDDEAIFAYKFFYQLAEICEFHDAVIRFVYGTESHEMNQYRLYEYLFKDRNIDYRIVKEITYETLHFNEENLDILYIPEEYVSGKGYYEEFFSEEKRYDYVFGHGVIREGMKEAALTMNDSEKSSRKRVIAFSAGQLKRICRGEVYFGHYHINCEMIPNVFYVGSYSRWIYGEESDKGYYTFSHKIGSEKYDHSFCVNSLAQSYVTISYGYSNPIFKNNDSLEQGLLNIDKMLKSKIYDHVRFEFNVPESCENPEYVIQRIRNQYKDSKNVKANIIHGYIEKRREKEKKEISEDAKYDFIFDKGMPKEEMLSSYIALDYGYEIPPEKVASYLYDTFENIISE